MSFGMMLDDLPTWAPCTLIIQVQPTETKHLRAPMTATTRAETLKWAVEKYPNRGLAARQEQAPARSTRTGICRIAGAEVPHAGIPTEEFRRSIVLWEGAAQDHRSKPPPARGGGLRRR